MSLQELDPKLGFDLIKQFTSIVGKVVGAIKNGVEAFKRIMSTDFSLKDIVDDFVKAVSEMPEKVLDKSFNIMFSNFNKLERGHHVNMLIVIA